MSQKILFVTNMGEFEVELYVQHCPKTCKNFYEMSKKNFYTGAIFHRLLPNFIIQCGNPKTGNIFFESEISPSLKHTGAGIIGMMGNTSQFYITLAPCPKLDGQNTIFGRLSSGLETINNMSRIQVNKQNQPSREIKVLNVRCK